MPHHFSATLLVTVAAFGAGHISSHMIFLLYFKCKSRVLLIPLMFRIDLETKDVLRNWGQVVRLCGSVGWFQFTGDKGPGAPAFLLNFI